jgi:hypothetical protein
MVKQGVQLYLVSVAIAKRTGFAQQRYITKDGRYIVNDRDLRVARLTDSEKADQEQITQEQAKLLIAENGYKTGNSLSK